MTEATRPDSKHIHTDLKSAMWWTTGGKTGIEENAVETRLGTNSDVTWKVKVAQSKCSINISPKVLGRLLNWYWICYTSLRTQVGAFSAYVYTCMCIHMHTYIEPLPLESWTSLQESDLLFLKTYKCSSKDKDPLLYNYKVPRHSKSWFLISANSQSDEQTTDRKSGPRAPQQE